MQILHENVTLQWHITNPISALKTLQLCISNPDWLDVKICYLLSASGNLRRSPNLYKVKK